MSDVSTMIDKYAVLLGGTAAEKPQAETSKVRCPITGAACEGDLSHLCGDYGCARKGGLSPHSHENF